MPISEVEFNAGRTWDTVEGQILSYLKANRNLAFTLSEILFSIGHGTAASDFLSLMGNIASLLLLQGVMEKLVKEGSIKAKIVKTKTGEQTFYMAS